MSHVSSLRLYQPLPAFLSRDDDKPQACFLCLVDVPKAVWRSSKEILVVLLYTGRPSLELYPAATPPSHICLSLSVIVPIHT